MGFIQMHVHTEALMEKRLYAVAQVRPGERLDDVTESLKLMDGELGLNS